MQTVLEVPETGLKTGEPKEYYEVDERVVWVVLNLTEEKSVERISGTVIAAFKNGKAWTHRLRLDGGRVVGNIAATSILPLLE